MSFGENTEKLVKVLIDEEYKNACSKYGFKYHSLHEAYAVLLEEMEEAEEGHSANKLFLNTLWDNIKGKPIYRTNYDCLDKMLNNVKHTISDCELHKEIIPEFMIDCGCKDWKYAYKKVEE